MLLFHHHHRPESSQRQARRQRGRHFTGEADGACDAEEEALGTASDDHCGTSGCDDDHVPGDTTTRSLRIHDAHTQTIV